MEMTLTVHLPRRHPRPVDVVVRWSGRHTADDLCRRLADHLGEPVEHLTARGRPVPGDAVLGQPPLLHGAEVTVTTKPGTAGSVPPAGMLEVTVVGGPDAGHARALSPPGLLVGRAAVEGLHLADEALSRVHAVLRVGEAGVVVADEGSTNGVLVDGVPVRGPTPVDSSSVIGVGASTLRLHRPPGPGVAAELRGDGRLVVSTPQPTSTLDDVVEVVAPAPPPERPRARVPWVAALVPVPVGVGLAVFLGPQLLAFALLGPVMLLASALSDRWGSGRLRRREAARHESALHAARTDLERLLTGERRRLDHTHLDPHAVLETAELRLPAMWCGGNRLPLRVGLGHAPTRVVWVDQGTRSRPERPHTPVVVSLLESGCLGVVGPPATTDAVLRSLLGQLCVTQPPTEVHVAVADRNREVWGWLGRVPHAVTLPAVGGEPGAPAARGSPAGPTADVGVRVLVVPSSALAGATPTLAAARAQGWLLLVAATTPSALPSGCAVVLTVGRAGHHVLERVGQPPLELVADGVGPWWAERVSRALAPLSLAVSSRGAAPVVMPAEVSLDELLTTRVASPGAVAAGWAAAAAAAHGLAPPRAVVGVGQHGVQSIDLVRDGPHLLVGGTTGSGKSEFLRVLVTSLAVSASPQDLTLVLVDFKGGAAFGPCAGLPHVVGVVTDLDDHLATRALVSLRAELRRREHLLAAAGAQDLDAYARTDRSRADPLPRLVLVVDELRTLVDEVPEFVSGLVRLAAQGRSLGIHLVLATQRPAGAVTAEVQANVNLRIAFRVRDRADSVAVVEDGVAADISPRTPGRAVMRGADGRLRAFQSAIAGPAHEALVRASLEVFAADAEVDPPQSAVRGGDDVDEGDDSDRGAERAAWTARLVTTIARAHLSTGRPAPRRPWLPPLPALVTSAQVRSAVDRHSPASGVVALGLVDEPVLQRVVPLRWEPGCGPWLVAGRPRSGRTSALRSLVTSAASHLDASALHVHLVDPGSDLCDLAHLPHVGTHVSGTNARALEALVDHLQAVVSGRRDGRRSAGPSGGAGQPATVLVVVDGWEQVLDAYPETLGPGVVEALWRVLRDGAAVGVIGAVSGGRALLQPRWTALGGSTILLGALDPLDVALAGLRAADVPREPPPGRGIRLSDRREVQLVLVTREDLLAAAAAHDDSAAASADARGVGLWPWRHRPLPDLVALPPSPAGAAGPGAGAAPPAAAGPSHAATRTAPLPLGLSGERHEECCWSPEQHGPLLLVAGPPRSGRSNVLRVVTAALVHQGRSVLLVTRNAGGQGRAADGGGRVPPAGGAPGVTEVTPDDVDAVVAARRRDRRTAVLVDDADLLDDAPVAGVLREILELVDRDGGLFVAVTTSTGLVTRFRGLDVQVARRACGLLLAPHPRDGDVLGVPVPRGIPTTPGRGVFVQGGVATEAQVYLVRSPHPTVSGVGAPVGVGAREGLGGHRHPERRHGREGGEPEHEPAHEGLVALHETETHGHEEGAPYEGGRPGPATADQPPAGQGGQPHPAQEDQHGRHDDPGRVTPLAENELHDVEEGETDERQRLDPGEGSDETTWPA